MGGISEADLVFNIDISYKEARKTVYWIKLLAATDYFSNDEAQSLINDALRFDGRARRVVVYKKPSKIVYP